MLDAQLGLCAAISLALPLCYYWHLIRRPNIRRPPSPSSLPLVGNLFSIPSGPEHLAFTKLGEQLKADVFFLEIFGQKLLILNSAEAASQILDKRSAIYSDRPPIPMVTDPALMNWSKLVTVVGYNDLWRHYRRIMHNWLNMRAVSQFNDLQEQQSRLLLQRLLRVTDQVEPFQHVKDEFFFSMASSMFRLAYGYELQGPRDIFFREAQQAAHNALMAGMPTNFFVNTFPLLSYIPDWFPGTGWKRTAREWRTQQEKAKTEPYEWAKTQVANGTNQPSLLAPLIQGHQLLSELSSAERDERLKEVGFIMFGGGTDTSAYFLVNLVAALVLNPQVQERAQEELDTVLGPVILPSISDKERLPYIRNLIDEVLRLYPVLPLGAPHACFQDDSYRGYDIQKGTTVLGNIWAIGRDPRHYKDPEVFNPDRYLDSDVPRPPAFGWGRRKCPGIHFAENSTFITAALLLAVFTFSKKKDHNGQEVVPQIEPERNSFTLELKPFGFEFKPRSDKHRQLILGVTDE
ncbi:cytochrome P450 [Rhizoctonia solani]|nr:cytochrome P450 [Rhizoctonia solani]